jgi:ABC-type branched-subunit amino acid transport system ATPase component
MGPRDAGQGAVKKAMATLPHANTTTGANTARSVSQEPTILATDGLTKHFGGQTAVDHVSLEVKAGAITGVIGPNGAGKTTLMGLVAGALRPDSGTVRFLGNDITRLPTYRRARIGLARTFQISGEFAKMTVIENLMVAAPRQVGETWRGYLLGRRGWQRQETDAAERARAILHRFNMAGKERELAGGLSGGQKRLLEVMRALMTEPTMLLLDEPMAGVNPRLARSVEDHLLELRDDGITMMLVEHELGTVGRLCDRVVVMARGRILADGTMDELQGSHEVVDAYLVG